MADFQTAIEYVLLNEGSEYTDDPEDGGGPTKWGITLDDLARWRQLQNQPVPTADDVQNLTKDEAISIYQEFYWKAQSLDDVTDISVATAILDMSVNLGNYKAAIFAQTAAGVAADGDLGSESLLAINKMDRINFFYLFIHQVQQYYVNIVLDHPGQIKFLNGWLNRSQKLVTLL